MRGASLLWTLLLASAGVSAQVKVGGPAKGFTMDDPSADKPHVFTMRAADGGTSIVYRTVSPGLGCPVGFSVERRSASEVVFAGDGSRRVVHGQGVEVTFNRLNGTEIRRASMVVHGTSGRVVFLPASGSSDEDVTENFELGPGTKSAGLQSQEVRTRTMGTVSWVELTQIEYADGFVWHESQSARCTATPSLFVLVGSGGEAGRR